MSIIALKKKSAAKQNLSGGGGFQFGARRLSTGSRLVKKVACCDNVYKIKNIDSRSEKQYSDKLENLKVDCGGERAGCGGRRSLNAMSYSEYMHFYKNQKVLDITK